MTISSVDNGHIVSIIGSVASRDLACGNELSVYSVL